MIDIKEIGKILNEKVIVDHTIGVNNLTIKNKYNSFGKIIDDNLFIYSIDVTCLCCKYIKEFEEKNIIVCFYLEDYIDNTLKCFVLENLISVLETERDISRDNLNTFIYNTVKFYNIEIINGYNKLNNIYTYEKRKNILKEIL